MERIKKTPPALVSVIEFAYETGLKPITIRQWVMERRISSVKLGRRRLIPVTEVQRLIQENLSPALPGFDADQTR